MTTQKILTALGTVALVALLLLPGAAAQGTPTVSIEKSSFTTTGLKPEIDVGAVKLDFIYATPNQAQSLGSAASQTATANVNIVCSDNTNVIITGPKTVNFPVAPQETEHSFSASFQVAVTRDLPGLKQVTCEYTADVEAITQTALEASNTFKSSFQVSAAFFSLVQAKIATQIKEAGPYKEVPFEVQLDNFGNARTQIQFSIEEKPGGKWSAVVPDDVILDSPSSGGGKTSDVAIFTIQTPYKNGWNNEQGTYRLKMKTFAADDPESTGVELGTNMLVRVRGVYVPSLEPMVMLGAVLGAALVARMVRRE